jgi:hypothetical protein
MGSECEFFMPKIVLKPNSPEFQDARAKASRHTRLCDMPGCRMEATHRAPKDRSLGEYHHFCQTHVQDYNAAWDFFSGMADRDIEDHIVAALYGDRPTWRSDIYRGLDQELRAKIHATYIFDEPEPQPNPHHEPTGNPELDALTVLGLRQPVTFAAIKTRYRELVKQYHPDSHGSTAPTQDLIKRINMAYTILKMAFRTDAMDEANAAE